jgi:hypothetical protein
MPLQSLGCVIQKFLGSIAALLRDALRRPNAILNCIGNG